MVMYPSSPFGPWVTEYLPLSAFILMVVQLGKIHLDSTAVVLSGKSASISHVTVLNEVNCGVSCDGCVEVIGVAVNTGKVYKRYIIAMNLNISPTIYAHSPAPPGVSLEHINTKTRAFNVPGEPK